MKIEKPITEQIDHYAKLAGYLQKHINKLDGTIFKTVPVKDIIFYLEQLASVEARLWAEVRKTYPEVNAIGVQNISVNSTKVTWDELDILSEDSTTKTDEQTEV